MTRWSVVLLLLASASTAQAQTKAQAYDAAAAALSGQESHCVSSYSSIGAYISGQQVLDNAPSPSFSAVSMCLRGTDGTTISPDSHGHTYHTTLAYSEAVCVAPEVYDRASDSCMDPQARCLAKNDDAPVQSAEIYLGQKCRDGCVYGARPGTGDASYQSTTIIYGSIGFTGETCSEVDNPDPPPPKDQTCVPAGDGMTMCIKKNGDHCYSASTGRMICWTPGETGTKSDGNVIQTRGPGTSTPPAPTPPPGETTTPGTGPTTTTTNTTNNVNITTTTRNDNTGSGTDGPNQGGEPDDGSGDGEGDGEGGAPGEGLGDFYEADGRTVGEVFGAFKTRIESAPIAQVSGDFFAMDIAGACPVWSVPASDFTPTLTLDLHCSPEFSTIMEYAGWVVLAIAAFCAFRIALY